MSVFLVATNLDFAFVVGYNLLKITGASRKVCVIMSIKIVSFNLRCAWDDDGINCFLNRAGRIIDKINTEKPEVIGFQEATDKNIKFLKSALCDYDIFFNQRDKNFGGEGLAIAIRRDSVTLLALDFFWLSETPYTPGSRYAIQSPCPRVSQTAILKTADNKLFRVYNNHLDHESDEARILGIKQVMERVALDKSRIDLPFFILGDFNAFPDSETIAFCNTYADPKLVDITSHIECSFHAYGTYSSKIDYIYTDVETAKAVKAVEPWTDEREGVYLSDHYPICAELEI